MTVDAIRRKITSLKAMTEARGATPNEAAMARAAISRLQAKLPVDDVKSRAQVDPAFTDSFIFMATRPQDAFYPGDTEVREFSDDFLDAMRNWTRTGTMRTRRYHHAR